MRSWIALMHTGYRQGDWSIRPHGEVWDDLINNQWWTPASDFVSDANGDLSIEGFLGDYSYTLTYGNVVRTGTFSLENSFQSGLENSIVISLDASLPESVEITSSHPGYICSGDLVRLQAHEAEGLTYLWEKDGVELEPQESSILAGDSGLYTVTISKNGLSMSSAPYVLELRESPASEMLADGDLEICQGATITFSVDGVGLNEYEWYRNNYPAQWGNTQFSASTPGAYQVEVISNGCASLSDPLEVVVHSLPDADVQMVGVSTFCAGGSVLLNAGPQAGVIYNWYRGEELLDETGTSLTASESGSYSLVALKQAEAGTSLLSLSIENSGLYTLRIIRGVDIQIHKVINL